MRNTQERVQAVQARANSLKKKKAQRMYVLTVVGSGCVSMGIIVLLACAIPSVLGNSFDSSYGEPVFFASVFSNVQGLGYVLIGILAFLLGISVTMLCILMRKKRDRDEH